MTSFADARVLVVGGSSGIGLAAAQAFAESGAAVTIASRSQAKLDHAVSEIGPGATAAVLDVTDDAAVEHFLGAGGVWDHVVVSSAATRSGPARELALEDAYAAMSSKFWGAYRIARGARISSSGSLTLVSGFLSIRPSPTAVLQGAINAAVEALGRGLALELAPVRVNTVSPGAIDTPLWNRLEPAARQAVFARVAASLPVRRVGRAEDVANAILYLAGTSFATGSTVLLDGGGALV